MYPLSNFFESSDITHHSTDFFPVKSDAVITTKYLAPAKINCPTKRTLNYFALEQRNGTEFRYIYKCKKMKVPLKIRCNFTIIMVILEHCFYI